MNRLALALLILFLAACNDPILHEVSESHANRALVALQDAGVKAEKRQKGDVWDVLVDKNHSSQALSFLTERRLLAPRAIDSSSSTKGLVSSREERRFQLIQATASRLEKTLARVPGVIDARVHLHIEKWSPLLAKKANNSSASVLLILSPEFEQQDMKLTELVAGASGLDAKQVEIVTFQHTPTQLTTSSNSRFIRSIPKPPIHTWLASVLVIGVGTVGLKLCRRRSSEKEAILERLRAHHQEESQ